MNSRSNIGAGSFRMSGPRISADVDSPRVELTPRPFDRTLELLDADIEPGLDGKRSTYDASSSAARDGSEGMSTGPRREANVRPSHDHMSDDAAASGETKKPAVKKWTPAENVKRENPKKRFDYGKVPYERLFPKDEDIAKLNYRLTPQNNAMTKEASEMRKKQVDSGDEERSVDKDRYPRRGANKVEPQKVREYKGSDHDPKLHTYDTTYAYDRCDSPYALNYLNSKGFSHAIPEPGQDPVSASPRAARPPGDTTGLEASPPSRRPRRRSIGGGGGGCCCSKGAVEVDAQNPQVKHHSPGRKVHAPDADPGVQPATVETEPIYVSTLRYSFKNPSLVKPHSHFPDFALVTSGPRSPTTKPQKAAVASATPGAELRAAKPRAQTPPLKATPRGRHRNACCSDSNVSTINSPRRSPARIQLRTPTPEVDLNLSKSVENVHPPEKIHIQGKVDPPEKINIQGKIDTPEKINIQGKVDTPEKIHIQGKADPPEKIHIQRPRVIFPKANFNNPRYTFKSPNPTLRAKVPTISRPSLRLAQPRTNYRLKTPPKLNLRRPRLGPIKPVRVNLPSLRRSKQNEAEAPKGKPSTEAVRPKNPKVIIGTPRVRVSGPRVKGPGVLKPAVDVKRPGGPSVKVNAKKLTPNATVEVPSKRPSADPQIKYPRPVEATVEGPELDFRDPYRLSTDISTPPSSRINSPELHPPGHDIPPSKPKRAEIRAPGLSLPRAEIRGGATKPTIRPIETRVRVPEPSPPKAELKGDVATPKISVKPIRADIPVTANEPDFNFDGPDVHISDPEFQRQESPHANANTMAPRDANFQLDAPRIRNPKVAAYNPRSMINPTFADLQINAPRSEVTASPPRIRTPDFEPKEPHIPDADPNASAGPGKLRIPEPKAEIRVPTFRESPEVRLDVTPPPKPTAHPPEIRAEVGKPNVSLPSTVPPTYYPPTEDLERPRPERGTISLPRLPQPPRASVKFDPDPPAKQSAPPPRNPSPPEQVQPPRRSSPQRPPTQKPPPQGRPSQAPPQQRPSPQRPPPERSPPQGLPSQKQAPSDTSRDQNPPWNEPIKWRLRPNTNTKTSPRGATPRGGGGGKGGGGGDHQDVDQGLTYYPPSKATIAHRILNGPLLKSRLT